MVTCHDKNTSNPVAVWYQIDTNFLSYDFHMRRWWSFTVRLNLVQWRQLARLSEKLHMNKQNVMRQSLAQLAEREGVDGKTEDNP